MNHSITIRELANAERKLLQSGKTSLTSILLLPIIPGGGVLMLGLLGYGMLVLLLEKVGIKIGESAKLYGLVGVILIAVLAGVYAAISFSRALARTRQQEKASLEQAKVEMIAVDDPVIIQQEEYNDEGPIYYLDIGRGKILFVCGQWMYEDQVYDPVPAIDTDDENWPPFPCESFVLHRIPETGAVLKIEIRGRKKAPVRKLKRKDVVWRDFYCSMVLDGSLENLQEAMRCSASNFKRQSRRSA